MKTLRKVLASIALIMMAIALIGCESGITLHFETNGGTPIEDVKLTVDFDLYNLTEPTKPGYAFAGWFTDEALSVPFNPETVITENLTLYAAWDALEYTVSISIDGVVTTQTVLHGEDAILPSNPTKEGYTFTGWSSTGENITADMTITAAFLINTYTLSFQVGDEVLFTREVNHGSALLSENIPVVPEVEGKDGVWNRSDFSNISANDVIEAVYTDKVYTVSYVNVYNDTNLGDASYGPYDITHGTTISSPTPDNLTGYVFANFDYDFSEPVTSDLVITAYYQRQSFIVTFRGFDGALLGQQTVLYGEAATAPLAPEIDGYTASDWDLSFDEVTATLTVTMGYVPNDYTLTFDTGEGSSIPAIIAPYQSVISAPADPTLLDKVFQGWYVSSDFSGDPFVFTDQTTMPLNGLTLYAKWDFASSYVLTVTNVYTDSTGSTSSNPLALQMDYLETYQPAKLIDGYNFVKYVINDVEYTDFDSFITLDSTLSVTVYYQLKTFTITFVQNPLNSGDQQIIEITKEYHSTLSLSEYPELILRDGYDVIWDRFGVASISSDMTISALYFSNTQKRVVFMDGQVIKYIAVQESLSVSKVLDESSSLLSITKKGYAFLGWFFDVEGTQPVDFTTFTYDSISTNSIYVYAKWEALIELNTPVITDVTSTTITWTVLNQNGLYPTQFKLLFDGMESIIIPATSVQSGDITTYTFIVDDLSNAGTHTVILLSLGNQTSSMNSPYSAVFTYVKEADPVEIVDETLIYDYFLIEKAGEVSTYILYTDMVYNFDSKYTFTITEGIDLVSGSANKLTTNNLTGTFSFDVYNSATSQTKHYQGKVVTYINQFALGTELSHYLSAIDLENDLFVSDTIAPYLIGSKNDFVFDLRILDSKGSRVDQIDTDLLYKFYLWNGTSYDLLTTNLSTYLTLSSDYVVDFKAAAEGKEFKVEIMPKYQATLVTAPTLNFEFTVNDGWNVFDDAELKTLFADFSVQTINLHSTIEATLNENQLNADGTPVNGYATPDRPGSSDGAKIYANPYIRMSGSIDNDNLVINGNYFTVNGSDLPYMNVNSDPDGGFTDTGFDGSFDVVSVQVAIFYYNVYQSTTLNNNHVAFNNLSIVGNTATPSINYSQSAEEILLAEALMSRNSGGYVGITIRNGNSEIYNTNIGLCTIGLTTNAYGMTSEGDIVNTYINYSLFYNEWANSIFGWAASQIEIENTVIGSSGGAAIHVEDNRPGSSGAEDPYVILHPSTTVNNWVSGQEAWFKAYAMTTAALQIKTLADSGIAPLNKTIIQEIENPVTGLATEMFNFVLLTKSLGGAESFDEFHNQVSGSEFTLDLPMAQNSGSILIEQPFNFLSYDPRVQDGTFAFAIDDLLDTTAFVNSVGYLMMTYGLSQADAGNLVYMAAFHNLTPDQIVNLYGAMTQYSMTWQQAYQALGYTGQVEGEARYMEISASVPGLGPIIMVTEYYARTPE